MPLLSHTPAGCSSWELGAMMLLPCLVPRLAMDTGRRQLAFAVAPLYVELRRQLQQLGEHTNRSNTSCSSRTRNPGPSSSASHIYWTDCWVLHAECLMDLQLLLPFVANNRAQPAGSTAAGPAAVQRQGGRHPKRSQVRHTTWQLQRSSNTPCHSVHRELAADCLAVVMRFSWRSGVSADAGSGPTSALA
jgi:hypothetical protein